MQRAGGLLVGLGVCTSLGCGPSGASGGSVGAAETETASESGSETETGASPETETGGVELPPACVPAPVGVGQSLGEMPFAFGLYEDCTIVAVDEVAPVSAGARFRVTSACPDIDPLVWELELDPPPQSFPLAPEDLVDVELGGESYSHTAVYELAVRDAATDALRVHWLSASGCATCEGASDFSPPPLTLTELELGCPTLPDDCDDARSFGLELGLGDASLTLTPAEPHGMIEDGDLRFEAWLDDLRRGWLLACVFGDLIDWTINYAVLASD